MTKIKFDIKEEEDWNVLLFELDGSLVPDDLKSINPPRLKGTKGVVLSGRGPIWLYGFLVHHYHPTKFLAIFDPRIDGGIIIESHAPDYQVGEVLKIEEGPE